MIYKNVSRADTSIRREISDSKDSTNTTMTKQSQVSLQQGGRLQQGPINASMTQQMSIKRKRRQYRRQGPVNDSMTSDFITLVKNEFCESRDEKSRWKIISSSMSHNQQQVVIKPEYNPSTFEIEPSLRRYNSEVPISAALRFRFGLLLLVDNDGLYSVQVKDMIEGRPSGLPLGEGRRRAIIDSTQKKIHKRCKKIAKVMNGNSSSINDIPCEEEDLQRVFHYQFGAKSRGESVMIRPSILRNRIVSDSDDENNALAIVLIAVVCLFGMLKLYNWESVVALKVYEIGSSLYQLI